MAEPVAGRPAARVCGDAGGPADRIKNLASGDPVQLTFGGVHASRPGGHPKGTGFCTRPSTMASGPCRRSAGSLAKSSGRKECGPVARWPTPRVRESRRDLHCGRIQWIQCTRRYRDARDRRIPTTPTADQRFSPDGQSMAVVSCRGGTVWPLFDPPVGTAIAPPVTGDFQEWRRTGVDSRRKVAPHSVVTRGPSESVAGVGR